MEFEGGKHLIPDHSRVLTFELPYSCDGEGRKFHCIKILTVPVVVTTHSCA